MTKKGHQEARTNRNGKPLKGLSEIAMPLDDFFDLVTKNSYPDIAHEYGYTVASVRGLVTVRVTEKALRDGVSRHAVKQSINLDRAIHGVIKNPRRGNIRARTEVPLFGVRSSRPGVPASAQSERSMPEHWRIIAADASDQQSPGALDITPDSVASSSTKSNTNSANTSRREQLKQEYHTTYAKKYDKIEATKARGEQPSRERYDSLIEQHERLAAIKREIETELGTQKEPTEAEDVPRTPGYAMPDTPGVPCMPGAGVSAGIDYGTPRTPGYAMPDTPGVPCLLTRDYQVIQAPQAKASTNNLGGRKQGKTAVTPRTPEYSPDGDFTAWNLSENFSRDDFNEGKSSPKRPADFYDEPFVSEDEWLEQYCKG